MSYNVFMTERYTLDYKPTFKDGEMVLVDMSCFGFPPEIAMGKIVGRGSEHIIDHWLVEFGHNFAPTYPYKVVSVQHTFILKKNEDLAKK